MQATFMCCLSAMKLHQKNLFPSDFSGSASAFTRRTAPAGMQANTKGTYLLQTASPVLAWSGSTSLPRRIGIVVAASAFVAICAHISIPLPFTTVPLTLQPFAVLLVGLLLSPLDAFLALTIYLAEGASGLPVFTPSGPGGMLQLLGPNGGFLLSYPLAAAVAATIFRTLSRHIRSFGAATIAGTVAIALIFTSGATWFGTVLHASLHTVWIGAIAPFLPGEVVKIFAAAGIASALTQKRG